MSGEWWVAANGVGTLLVGVFIVWIDDRTARIGFLMPFLMFAVNFGAELSRLGVFR